MILPGWLEPLLDADTMRATDEWAIQTRGIPASALMERAGAELTRVVVAVAATATAADPAGPVAVVCGRGNNGGDGLVVARKLRDAGREVDVWLSADPGELSRDATRQLAQLPGASPRDLQPEALKGASIVVDALLGTGFRGDLSPRVAAAITAINEAGRPVVSADVPSGVDASTGEVREAAVQATATVAFHRGKPGLWIAPGKAHAGVVHVVDIGIPSVAPFEASTGLIDDDVLLELPHRSAVSTKFTSGRVVVVGGSRGLTGAPALAALAAQRAGAGYVTVAAPASLEAAFAARLLEAMFAPLGDHDGRLHADAVDAALDRCEPAGAVVLGPGLGRDPGTAKLVRRLAKRISAPLVLDADGLNAFAGRLDGALSDRGAATVLTPHAGELARLLDTTSVEVGRRRLHSAREAARRAQAVVVCKGDDTLVASPDGRVAISPGDAPGLATAGTGDVLAGVIGALLARGLPAETAASAGVAIHRRAGRLAARPHGPDGVIASDVITALPAAQSPRPSL